MAANTKMKIYLYLAIPSSASNHPIDRRGSKYVRNRLRRLLDLGHWTLLRRTNVHYNTFENHKHSNRGDIALLRAFEGLPKGATIIDAPCGTGRLAETLLEAGYNVIGLDIAAPMLDVANRKLARFGDRFQSHVRDVRTLDPNEFTADAVLCARVLMHFPLEEQIEFLKSVALLTTGPVIFNQSLLTPWHQARRALKRALGNQSPASYPLVATEVTQLVDQAGLRIKKMNSVQPLVSEAVFWSCNANAVLRGRDVDA